MLLKKEVKAVPSAGKVLSKSQFQGLLTFSLLLFQYLAPEKEEVRYAGNFPFVDLIPRTI